MKTYKTKEAVTKAMKKERSQGRTCSIHQNEASRWYVHHYNRINGSCHHALTDSLVRQVRNIRGLR